MGKKETEYDKRLRKAQSAIDDAMSSLSEAESQLIMASSAEGPEIFDGEPHKAALHLCDLVEKMLGYATTDESIESHDVRMAARDFRDACRPIGRVDKDLFAAATQKSEAA